MSGIFPFVQNGSIFIRAISAPLRPFRVVLRYIRRRVASVEQGGKFGPLLAVPYPLNNRLHIGRRFGSLHNLRRYIDGRRGRRAPFRGPLGFYRLISAATSAVRSVIALRPWNTFTCHREESSLWVYFHYVVTVSASGDVGPYDDMQAFAAGAYFCVAVQGVYNLLRLRADRTALQAMVQINTHKGRFAELEADTVIGYEAFCRFLEAGPSLRIVCLAFCPVSGV